MAHRLITQIVFTGSRVVGRAFVEAYRQASATQKYAQQGGKDRPGGKAALVSGLTLDEACKILNVKTPKDGQTSMEDVLSRYQKLFDLNNPQKGGSFYLQSKVVRAKERIEMEVKNEGTKGGQETASKSEASSTDSGPEKDR